MNKKLFELIYIGFFAYVFLIGLYVHFYFLIKFLKGMLQLFQYMRISSNIRTILAGTDNDKEKTSKV